MIPFLFISILFIAKSSVLNSSQKHNETDSSLDTTLIWIVYDQIYGSGELNEALSYSSDMIFRGWFKWDALGSGFGSKSWMVQQANSQGTLFGGGGTCSALYQNEVTPEKFQRIVSRNPDNQPEYFHHTPSSGCYHGDIQNTEYLDFVLSWIYNQIDAGVQSVFLDEPDGAASWFTGYGDNGIEDFRSLLINKYVNGESWSLTDTRWQSVFQIDLTSDCSDGTMLTFNYRDYLQRKGLSEHPYWDSNQLKHEWGDPWTAEESTHIYHRNQNAWQYFISAIRSYCEENNKTVTIANEDFLIETHWDTWTVENGRLDISPTYIQHWRNCIEQGIQNLGQKVPLIFFHDWSFDMPFYDHIPPEDRILWLRVYGAELFASGGILAWPVSGSGNQYKACHDPVLEDRIRSLITWYRSHQDLFLNAEWTGHSLVNLYGETDCVNTIMDQSRSDRRIVHLINKKQNTDHQLISRESFQMAIPCTNEPRSVWTASPDDTDRSLDFTWQPASSRIVLTINQLKVYTVVVIEYSESDISFNQKAVPGQFQFFQNYPNPFNAITTIKYWLAKPDNVELTVYNAAGQKVMTLVDEKQETGYHSVIWNGRNKYGMEAPSGLYLYHIRTADLNRTGKTILMK